MAVLLIFLNTAHVFFLKKNGVKDGFTARVKVGNCVVCVDVNNPHFMYDRVGTGGQFTCSEVSSITVSKCHNFHNFLYLW
jgi:hypothetical protein